MNLRTLAERSSGGHKCVFRCHAGCRLAAGGADSDGGVWWPARGCLDIEPFELVSGQLLAQFVGDQLGLDGPAAHGWRIVADLEDFSFAFHRGERMLNRLEARFHDTEIPPGGPMMGRPHRYQRAP